MTASDMLFTAAAAAAVLGNAVIGIAGLKPTPEASAMFEVHSIRAQRVEGGQALLWVDRTVHRPVHQTWSVRVMEATPQGWRETCATHGGPILYEPDNVLDQPVTLDWWTQGACPTLPAAPAKIVTTWAPTALGVEPQTVVVQIP